MHVGRVHADQLRPEFGDAGPHARGVGRQVGGAERAALGIAGDAGIGDSAANDCLATSDFFTVTRSGCNGLGCK